eukprot:2943475-Pleurochrysis_carterae.AAC.2
MANNKEQCLPIDEQHSIQWHSWKAEEQIHKTGTKAWEACAPPVRTQEQPSLQYDAAPCAHHVDRGDSAASSFVCDMQDL